MWFETKQKLDDFLDIKFKSHRFLRKKSSSCKRCFFLVRVQYHPQDPFDDTIERFFVSLRFDQRRKLNDLGIEIYMPDREQANFGSSPIPSFIRHAARFESKFAIYAPFFETQQIMINAWLACFRSFLQITSIQNLIQAVKSRLHLFLYSILLVYPNAFGEAIF